MKFQDAISGYPPWVVIGGSVVVLGLLFMLLGRVLRIVGVLMFVALACAAVWYGWKWVTEEPEPPAPQAQPPFYPILPPPPPPTPTPAP